MRAIHVDSILADGATGAPGEFLLFRAGTNSVDAGEKAYIVDDAAAASVLEAFKAHGADLVIDYEHQTLGMHKGVDYRSPDGTAPAAGWIKALRWEPARGIIAQVEWTKKAQQLIADREYRYFSPVYYTDEDNRLVEVENVALTNWPKTDNLIPLAARRDQRSRRVAARDHARANRGVRRIAAQRSYSMDAIAKLLGLSPGASVEAIQQAVTESNAGQVAQALGLPEDATMDEVKSAITSLGGQVAATRKSVVREIAKGLGLGDVEDENNLVIAIKARTDENTSETKKLLARVVDLEKRVADGDFDAIIATKGKGRVMPAHKATFRKIFDADPAGFPAYLETLPVIAGERSVFEGEKVTDSGEARGAVSGLKSHAFIIERDKLVAGGKSVREATRIIAKQKPELHQDFVAQSKSQ